MTALASDQKSSSSNARARARRRVLIVDDNAASADTLAEVVELLGHAAVVARDGPSAIAKARDSAPNVVICDIGLPGMTGHDVARALRAAGTDARLVALSGYGRPSDVEAAKAAGFDAYVVKPADLDEIERLLS
jgi:CheY-like chemotaxis protein